jgi:hypothetical protein
VRFLGRHPDPRAGDSRRKKGGIERETYERSKEWFCFDKFLWRGFYLHFAKGFEMRNLKNAVLNKRKRKLCEREVKRGEPHSWNSTFSYILESSLSQMICCGLLLFMM